MSIIDEEIGYDDDLTPQQEDCLALGHREEREMRPHHWYCDHCDAEWFDDDEEERL